MGPHHPGDRSTSPPSITEGAGPNGLPTRRRQHHQMMRRSCCLRTYPCGPALRQRGEQLQKVVLLSGWPRDKLNELGSPSTNGLLLFDAVSGESEGAAVLAGDVNPVLWYAFRNRRVYPGTRPHESVRNQILVHGAREGTGNIFWPERMQRLIKGRFECETERVFVVSGQPFSAPAVIPLTRCFWRAM
jgi:hypothetical protein